jgi:hypothetical protein
VVISKNTGRPAAVQAPSPGARILRDAEWLARPCIGQGTKPAQHRQIEGRNFSIRFVLVNRPCFDHYPTPTAHFTVDGKRVSRTAAYSLAASLLTERRGL